MGPVNRVVADEALRDTTRR
jgi:enoyl-CoA hydratase